jgi:hypothetical protein
LVKGKSLPTPPPPHHHPETPRRSSSKFVYKEDS